MEICLHLIDDRTIIGIGPLYAKSHSDTAMRSLYNAFRYQFEVHCKTRSIMIESDYFKPEGGTEFVNAQQKESYEKWEQEYYKVRAKIAEHIGEIIPDPKP